MPRTLHSLPRTTRRRFLKLSAAAASLAAVASLSLETATAAPALRPHASAVTYKVGVVLPQSALQPMLASSFLAGMRLYRAQGGARGAALQLVVADYGISPALARAQVRALIEQQGIHLVVSALSAGVAEPLQGLLHERAVPLIISGAGANIPRMNQSQPSPYILYNSLSYWQSSWALGSWAAGNLGRNAFVVGSFYDSGYDAPYAFRLGLEHAGGTVVQARVTHRPGDSDDFRPLLEAIRRQRPDFVYASYCGAQAQAFVRAYAASGLARRTPLIGASFLVDETLLPELGKAAQGIRTALPWAASLRVPASRTFGKAFRTATGRPADAFAALGYDAAHLAALALGSAAQPAGLQQALAGATWHGPRGPVAFDPATQALTSPIYLREVRGGSAGWRNVALAELAPPPATNAALAALRAEPRTGWLNTYLCA